MQAQRLGGAAQRPAGAHALHKGIDAPIGLRPYLVAQIRVARQNIKIVELIRKEMPGLLAEVPRCLDQGLDQFGSDLLVVAADDLQLGPQRLHMRQLFGAERVR